MRIEQLEKSVERRARFATINPFRLRIFDYPSQLLCFEEKSEHDAAVLLRQIQGADRVIVELGSGSGQHLVGLALRHPSARAVGFELRYKRAVRTIEKGAKAGAGNITVVRGCASRLAELFPPASIDQLHVNFPDPWEKKRQRKHRILSERLLEQLDSLLRVGGFLSVKTDHREYFESFMAIVASDERFAATECSFDLASSEYDTQNIPTEFELLFRAQNLPIHYAKIIRRS